MKFAVFLAVGGAAIGLGLWLGTHVTASSRRKRGVQPARWRRSLALMAVIAVFALVATWLLLNGQPAVGIGMLVAIYIVPTLVATPLRIRRANKRAREARLRRRDAR